MLVNLSVFLCTVCLCFFFVLPCIWVLVETVRVCRLANGIRNEARNGCNKSDCETKLTRVSVRIYSECEQPSIAEKKRYNLNQFATVYRLDLDSVSCVLELCACAVGYISRRLCAVIHRTFNSLIPNNDLFRFNANTVYMHTRIETVRKKIARTHTHTSHPVLRNYFYHPCH